VPKKKANIAAAVFDFGEIPVAKGMTGGACGGGAILIIVC
jgi:hypothetical protein